MKTILMTLALSPVLACGAGEELKPLLAMPDKVAYGSDFSKPAPLAKTEWGPRQGTQWKIEDGVLRGRPSTAEYRAKKQDHFGYEPRISAPITPMEFVAVFSVRFTGGAETAIVPFVEFGHHVVRVRLSKDGAEMVVDGESLRVGEAKDFKYEPGRWYHGLAELKGDEFVIQFENGPTFYARHECLAKAAPSGGSGFGLAGPKEGFAEVDNVTFWTVKPGAQPGWAAARAKLLKFSPVPAKAVPARKIAK